MRRKLTGEKVSKVNSKAKLEHHMLAKSSRLLKQLSGGSTHTSSSKYVTGSIDIFKSEFAWKRAQAISRRNFSQNWIR